jgi:hypothetical protein
LFIIHVHPHAGVSYIYLFTIHVHPHAGVSYNIFVYSPLPPPCWRVRLPVASKRQQQKLLEMLAMVWNRYKSVCLGEGVDQLNGISTTPLARNKCNKLYYLQTGIYYYRLTITNTIQRCQPQKTELDVIKYNIECCDLGGYHPK